LLTRSASALTRSPPRRSSVLTRQHHTEPRRGDRSSDLGQRPVFAHGAPHIPIWNGLSRAGRDAQSSDQPTSRSPRARVRAPKITDRKSTRLNSSHVKISYAVF